jgi:hypothetical protein
MPKPCPGPPCAAPTLGLPPPPHSPPPPRRAAGADRAPIVRRAGVAHAPHAPRPTLAALASPCCTPASTAARGAVSVAPAATPQRPHRDPSPRPVCLVPRAPRCLLWPPNPRASLRLHTAPFSPQTLPLDPSPQTSPQLARPAPRLLLVDPAVFWRAAAALPLRRAAPRPGRGAAAGAGRGAPFSGRAGGGLAASLLPVHYSSPGPRAAAFAFGLHWVRARRWPRPPVHTPPARADRGEYPPARWPHAWALPLLCVALAAAAPPPRRAPGPGSARPDAAARPSRAPKQLNPPAPRREPPRFRRPPHRGPQSPRPRAHRPHSPTARLLWCAGTPSGPAAQPPARRGPAPRAPAARRPAAHSGHAGARRPFKQARARRPMHCLAKHYPARPCTAPRPCASPAAPV